LRAIDPSLPRFGKYGKLAHYLRKYWPTLTLMVACGLALTTLNVIVPFLTGNAVQIVLANKSIAPVQIQTIAIEIVIISAIASVFQFGLGYGGQYLGQKIIYDMRNDLFAAIQGQSFSFHDKNQTGQLMARATGDVEAVRRFLAFGSSQLIGNILLIAFVAISSFINNIVFGIAVGSILPILLYVSWRFSQTQAPFWKKARENYGAINTVLQENITGMKVVRSFSAEERAIAKFDSKNKAYRDDIMGASVIRAFYTPLLTLIVSLLLGSVYFLGGFQVSFLGLYASTIAGKVVTQGSLVVLLIGPIRFLGQLILIFQNGMAGFTRVLEITESSVEISDKPNAVDLEREKVRGGIAFENVKFGYGKDRIILDDINLEIKPGEIVALLGASGSGKTTLANLIPRFYDVTQGHVLIDGIDVGDIKLKSLRSNVGLVSQDIFLFSATVRENISYGRENAPLDLVINASKIAQVDEFVNRFPEKYDTLVGERGVTLSGGQKQRIAIARTLITDPRILIMDDSLSSVDVETEYAIQDALRAVVAGRTSIIITQRLSTLRLANRIVVFENGRVVEDGTHEALLELNGAYARLYYSQLAPQEELQAVPESGKPRSSSAAMSGLQSLRKK
jgi:ATP-binding cassette, subfamily B, multidrug efflux pump